MEDLKNIKKTLIATIQSQLGNLDCVDTQEMGAVIDMIKDLEEACYYHTIVEAMESDSEQVRYYKEMSYYPNPKYDRDRYQQDKPYKMYYGAGTRIKPAEIDMPYQETKIPTIKRDPREGRSGLSRKGYIETRESHTDRETKIKELDRYMNDLTQDIVEIINDLSQEERDLLRNKMNGLMNRI